MRLRDKVMVVTGGASGIGRATALLCAQEGAKVIVMDIKSEPEVDDNQKLLGQTQPVRYLLGDVTKESDWKRILSLVESYFKS